MDCEKFESTLLDELYDELDEVTSAAAKRHVSGCARCGALLAGLKATRRLAVLPRVDPPADLEDRILAAAKEARKVVPLGRRVSNVVSLAGSWAMRPQTAMAALFLLMIGSSALLIKGKVAKPAASTMIVSEQGEPVAGTPVLGALGSASAVESGGLAKDAKGGSASPAATVANAASAPGGSAAGNDGTSEGVMGRAPHAKIAEGDRFKALDDVESSEGARGSGGGGAVAPQARLARASSAPGAAPYASPPPPPMAAAPAPAPQAQAALGSVAQQKASAPTTDFDNAMTAYNAGDYTTAAQLWDNGARNGDLNAALWEARSVRESSGCATAAARFDRVAQQAGVGAVANDAMFDAARCYRSLGQYELARARLNQLLLVPSYINRAQAELNAMGSKASAKARAAAAAAQSTPQTQAPAASPPAQSAPSN